MGYGGELLGTGDEEEKSVDEKSPLPKTGSGLHKNCIS